MTDAYRSVRFPLKINHITMIPVVVCVVDRVLHPHLGQVRGHRRPVLQAVYARKAAG